MLLHRQLVFQFDGSDKTPPSFKLPVNKILPTEIRQKGVVDAKTVAAIEKSSILRDLDGMVEQVRRPGKGEEKREIHECVVWMLSMDEWGDGRERQ